MSFGIKKRYKKAFLLSKTKSAPTEVSAPKNADSNCRQTKLIKHKENPCDQQAESAFLPNSKCRLRQKGIDPLYKNSGFSDST